MLVISGEQRAKNVSLRQLTNASQQFARLRLKNVIYSSTLYSSIFSIYIFSSTLIIKNIPLAVFDILALPYFGVLFQLCANIQFVMGDFIRILSEVRFLPH